jgi:hypothetical protein
VSSPYLISCLFKWHAGHKFLCHHGILHRDISAGNIFIWDSEMNGSPPPEGQDGFLADVELASVKPPASVVETVPAPADPGPHQTSIPFNTSSSSSNPSHHPTRSVFREVLSPPKSSCGPRMTVRLPHSCDCALTH